MRHPIAGILTLNLVLLGAFAAAGACQWLTYGVDHAWRAIGGPFGAFVLSVGIAGAVMLLVVQRWTTGAAPYVWAAGLAFVVSMGLTVAPQSFDALPTVGHWNWVGKLLALACALGVLALMPAALRRQTGILNLPRPESRRAVGIALAVFAALGVALGFSGGPAPDRAVETALFQWTMPSLTEEFLFRGILPALLACAVARGRRLAGIELHAGLVVSSLLFGLVHGLLYHPVAGLVLQPVPIVATGLLGAAMGWLTLRCGSVWPAVLAHSLLNGVGPLMTLAGWT